MLELAWPWAWLAVLLPVLVRWLVPGLTHQGGRALPLPFYAEAVRVAGQGRVGMPLWRLWLPALIYVLLVFGASRPQWLGEPQAPPQTGRDLMLAVDLSGSMAAEDMSFGGRRVDRLRAVKIVLDDFIERRAGDRLGLILFGDRAYQVTPLTLDRASVRHQLDTAVVGLAGRETAIGDAIGLAVKRLREREAGHRVLVLLTDGANNAGELEPLEAASLAQTHAVRVYTIAFGADGRSGPFGVLMPSPEIDEASLQEIANRTGGRFFRARDTRELAGIYDELDRLESLEQRGEAVRPRRELFPYPVTGALVLLLPMLLAGLLRPDPGAAA